MAIATSPNLTTVNEIQFLQRQAASLLLYQKVLTGEVGAAFLSLLQTLQQPQVHELECLRCYGSWFRAIASTGKSWQAYLLERILQDDNPFTHLAQKVTFANLPPALIKASRQDLNILQNFYECSNHRISQWMQDVAEITPILWSETLQRPTVFKGVENWGEAIETLANYYRQQGTGIFAQYRALRWQSGQLVGIINPDEIQITELVGYETQRDILLKNTEFLLAGYRALNILLYGSRGSGKSSLVKGLLKKYENLRLIEVTKSDLNDLPQIVEELREAPQKFVIFVDDLSFEEDDEAFKALKVVLEGNLTARPQNVVVYATSNRRHLIREFFGDRPRPSHNEEVHAWDTVQEKLSFSDRFGLTLTFEPANQDTYLEIVHHLANLAQIHLPWDEIRDRALQWATRHNGRSGRTARQFIDFLQAELGVKG